MAFRQIACAVLLNSLPWWSSSFALTPTFSRCHMPVLYIDLIGNISFLIADFVFLVVFWGAL